MKKTEVFVVTHKDKIYFNLSEIYKVIKVGDNQENFGYNYISDSTGNNISKKNKNYCELTAFYWLWKNYDLPDYVGICHYRRCFVKPFSHKPLDNIYINKVMKKYDVIMPKKRFRKNSIWFEFSNGKSGFEKDLISLKKLIKKEYNEYYKEFDKFMNGKSSSYYNMAIMKREYFNEYCKWLFEVLEKYEKYVDLSEYNTQQSRIYGFISEFLLNVWVKKHNLLVKYQDVLLYDDKKIKEMKRRLKLFMGDVI